MALNKELHWATEMYFMHPGEDFWYKRQDVKSLSDIKAFVANTDVEKTARNGDKNFYEINVFRVDNLMNGTKSIYNETHTSYFKVIDKFWTPFDIEKWLEKKFGTTYDFDKLRYGSDFKNAPAIVEARLFPSGQDKPTIIWRPLNDIDVVVDKKLQQIWPVATKQAPVILRKLFEISHDR